MSWNRLQTVKRLRMPRLSLERLQNAIVTACARRDLRRGNATVGHGFYVTGHGARISTEGGISLGNDVHLRATLEPVRLRTVGAGKIIVGNNVFMNTGVRVYAEDLVEIGSDVRIGDASVICDTPFHAVHEGGPNGPRPIRLGRNVWLGRNVIVLPGVTIGDHSVVASGAVVFQDIPAKQVWRGNPAVYVKDVRASDSFERT